MAAFQIFHRDICKSTLFPHIIDGDDVRMIETSRSFRFSKETGSRFGEFGFAEFTCEGDGLDRDGAINGGIAAEIDDPHGASADFALELISPETLRLVLLARHFLRGRRGRRGSR